MSLIVGTNSGDMLDGSSAADSILGGNGADTISAGDGADVISSGNGADTVDGGSGNDTIDGGNGDDILIGGSGDDLVLGGNGNDYFIHDVTENIDVDNSTYDFYDGARGSDTLKLIVTTAQLADLQAALLAFSNLVNKSVVFDFSHYVAYMDLKIVNIESIVLEVHDNPIEPHIVDYAGASSTLIIDQPVPDPVQLTNFTNDSARGIGTTSDVIINNDGDYQLTVYNFSNNTVHNVIFTDVPMDGNAHITVQVDTANDGIDHAYDMALGTQGDDVLQLNAPGLVYSLDGNDTITGSAGNDYVRAGLGTDTIHGGDGDDYIEADLVDGQVGQQDFIYGENGNDTLFGKGGNDSIYGGAGYDYISGDAGNDFIDGGDDVDMIVYANNVSSGVIVNLTLNNAASADPNAGTDFLINIENVLGSNFDDNIIGNGGNNVIIGLKGDDALDGLLGQDTYVFNLSVNEGHDIVSDNVTLEDILSFEGVVDTAGDKVADVNAMITSFNDDGFGKLQIHFINGGIIDFLGINFTGQTSIADLFTDVNQQLQVSY